MGRRATARTGHAPRQACGGVSKMSEQWMAIPGFPGYEASNRGRIRSLPRTVVTKAGWSRKQRGGVIAQWVAGRGYLYVTVGGKKTGVHRLVCLAFKGPPPTRKHHAAHWDGDQKNNRQSNLRWATPRENAFDMVKHGRAGRGGARSGNGHHLSKLTTSIVKRLRKANRSGRGWIAEQARKHGVHPSTLTSAIKGETWTCL